MYMYMGSIKQDQEAALSSSIEQSLIVHSVANLGFYMLSSQAMLENHYLYKVKQNLFNKGKEEIVNVSCTVVIRCDASKISLSMPWCECKA